MTQADVGGVNLISCYGVGDRELPAFEKGCTLDCGLTDTATLTNDYWSLQLTVDFEAEELVFTASMIQESSIAILFREDTLFADGIEFVSYPLLTGSALDESIDSGTHEFGRAYDRMAIKGEIVSEQEQNVSSASEYDIETERIVISARRSFVTGDFLDT